jgi:hypothetical protein
VGDPASGQGTESANGNGTSATVNLTQEELDRRIQAETDRREARRQQMTAQQQQFESRRKLRDEDPYAYAEQERQAEARQQYDQNFNSILGQVGVQHDRAVIDPIVLSLSESERNRIMAIEGAGVGLEGRKLVVSESLKALEKQWKADGARAAEARLRKNPAFRKQVFGEQRGSQPEPDLLPASGGSSGEDGDVSNILRRSLGRG